MRSIRFSSLFLPLHSYSKRTQNPKARDQFRFLKNEPTCLGLVHIQKYPSFTTFRTRAIVSPAIMAIVSPRGDATVLIKTGVGLFSMYIIANFVVPYFITKEFDEKEPKEEEEDTPS